MTSAVHASNHRKCVSLNNQQYMTQPTPINPHPDEYTKGLRYYQFVVKLDRCARICSTLNDLFNRVDILNKTED